MVSSRNNFWETSAEIPYRWRDTTKIEVVLLIGWNKFYTSQKHYPDLGSDASSVWNFCARFSDVISRGNHWWRREMSAAFSQANLFEVGKEGGTQTHYKSFRRAVGPLLLTVALILNPPRGFFLPFSKGKALQTRCVVLTLLKQPERRLRSFTVTWTQTKEPALVQIDLTMKSMFPLSQCTTCLVLSLSRSFFGVYLS